MRTAEEIASNYENPSIWGDLDKNRGGVYYADDVLKMLNEARRECIDDCAEAAKIEWQARPFLTQRPVVDKQSILKLKDQIK